MTVLTNKFLWIVRDSVGFMCIFACDVKGLIDIGLWRS